jgi:hypothetical protein
MSNKIKFEWEVINQLEANSGQAIMTKINGRTKVIGGWIVKSETITGIREKTTSTSESMVFISDPAHEWEVAK